MKELGDPFSWTPEVVSSVGQFQTKKFVTLDPSVVSDVYSCIGES